MRERRRMDSERKCTTSVNLIVERLIVDSVDLSEKELFSLVRSWFDLKYRFNRETLPKHLESHFE